MLPALIDVQYAKPEVAAHLIYRRRELARIPSDRSGRSPSPAPPRQMAYCRRPHPRVTHTAKPQFMGTLYRPLVATWRMYNSSEPHRRKLVATGQGAVVTRVGDKRIWEALVAKYSHEE